jgi:autotransporter-associated beta strand protein
MHRNRKKQAVAGITVVVASLCPLRIYAQTTTQDIRVATYNIQGDVSSPSPTGVIPYISTVLEGIGQEQYVGDNILQLPDIIALQETSSNSTNVAPIANTLNTYYGSNIFTYSTYQATQSGGNTSGNGPNALIYNRNTTNLIASVGVGTPQGSGNGEYRQVVRYEFQPIADTGTTNGIFYVYDSHYKAQSGTPNTTYRNEEAQIIRNDEAANLPASAAVLYVGDYNLDGSSEPMYQTLTAVKSPGGISQGQAFDPLNPTDNYSINWANNASYVGIMTDADTSIRYRDDIQTMTGNVYSDTPGNLDYIANSYHAFGNNGTVPLDGNVNSSGNTAVNDILGHGSMSPVNPALTTSQVLSAMNKSIGSDHLPVVADYSLALPAQNLTWNNAGATVINDGVTWDINHYLNWNSGSNVSTYTEGSTVTFNDANNGQYNVTLNSVVNPAAVIVNNSAGNYTISGTGTIAGTASLTKSGTGTLVLATQNTFTGGTTVNAGVLQTNPTTSTTSALPAGPVTINGGTLLLSSNVTLGSQTTPPAAPNSNVNISSLAISGNGTLDITNNHIIINYGSGADPIASIAALVASGYAGGTWTGSGIVSSIAAANSANYGIGYADAADPGNPAGLASGQIELMYTLLGDANLDGKVNGADFAILATNFNKAVSGSSGWDQGDFNNDGSINGADFAFLASNFNGGAINTADKAAVNAFAAANSLSTQVPEPATLGLVATAALLGLRRRR